MTNNLVLELAHRRVHDYAGEAVQRDLKAMACRDCEEFLQKGRDAYKWLRRAEETLREADYEGLYELSSEVQHALDELYLWWLSAAEFAEQWIAALANQGYHPDHVLEFQQACAEVREIVQQRDWALRTSASRLSAQSAEAW